MKTTNKIAAFFKKGEKKTEGLSNESFQFITNQANDTTLYIYDDIGWYGVEAQDFANALSELNGEPLTVRIASNGGSVSQGIAIYNMLRDYEGQVTTINDSVAASIASVIFMAGDIRKTAKTASFMTHKPMGNFYGNSDELVEFDEQLKHYNEVLAKAYEQGGVESAKARELLGVGNKWFMSDEAVEIGFATEESGAPAMAATVDLTKFDNVPEKVLNATLTSNLGVKPHKDLQNKIIESESGDVKMSELENSVTKEDHETAVSDAETKGFQAALTRRSEVLALESANGREKLVDVLIVNAKLSVEEIDAFLQASPTSSESNGLNASHLKDDLQNLGDGVEQEEGEKQNRVEAFASLIGKPLKS